MAEKKLSLSSLTIQATNEYAWVCELQEVLKIVQEQLDNPSEKTQIRVGLLIDLYLSAMDLHLDELRIALEDLRKMVGATPPPSE